MIRKLAEISVFYHRLWAAAVVRRVKHVVLLWFVNLLLRNVFIHADGYDGF